MIKKTILLIAIGCLLSLPGYTQHPTTLKLHRLILQENETLQLDADTLLVDTLYLKDRASLRIGPVTKQRKKVVIKVGYARIQGRAEIQLKSKYTGDAVDVSMNIAFQELGLLYLWAKGKNGKNGRDGQDGSTLVNKQRINGENGEDGEDGGKGGDIQLTCQSNIQPEIYVNQVPDDLKEENSIIVLNTGGEGGRSGKGGDAGQYEKRMDVQVAGQIEAAYFTGFGKDGKEGKKGRNGKTGSFASIIKPVIVPEKR